MINSIIPRTMIVGTGSGCGKTTVTCALLKVLSNMSLNISSFKCGPDYIDPMFHSKVLGTHSRNLDLFMCGEETVKYLLYKNAVNTQISVIEGVMGMYDGAADTAAYSSNHLSLVTKTPQILVVNGKGKSLSIVAEISGFLNFAENNIKGVIINNIGKGMYEFFKSMIESRLPIKVLGYLETNKECAFESRHLGLVTADEIKGLNIKLDKLAQSAKETLDIQGILDLAREYSDFSCKDITVPQIGKSVKIAVARDLAFCFYYKDNLDLLTQMGAEIEFFSPMTDSKLPEGTKGIVLGGGYPEEHSKALSENTAMLQCIKRAYEANVPIFAECGGFMYLGKSITDKQENVYPMVGLNDINFRITNKLAPFGYVTLTALKDNLLCNKGEQINGHDFHYSICDDNGDSFTVTKQNGKSWTAIYSSEKLWCGYSHLHFWSNISFAKNFLEKCAEVE